MLVTFKSKATADVVMYESHAQPILDLLHKDIKRGVITAAEAVDAIALLEKQIDHSKAHDAADALERDVHKHHNANGDDHGHEKIEPVSFSARAYPLLDMLRESQKGGHDILWGV
jgi:hypothetical protein